MLWTANEPLTQTKLSKRECQGWATWGGCGGWFVPLTRAWINCCVSFRASLANFPSNSNPHKWLGKFLQRQARTPNVTGAAHHYRLALQRDAMDYVCNNNLGAILLDSRTHLGEAERAFRRALQVEPNSVASMSNLGRVLHFRGRSQEAADYLYASLERINATPDWPQTPTSSPALLHRALAMIWAHVPNRERVAMHCQQGGCDTDAVLAEFSGVAS